MSYAQKLMELLRPLGVYTFRDGSFSMGQLEALGAQLDSLSGLLAEIQRESLVMSAENEGLTKAEALFPFKPPAQTLCERRNAIAAFWQIADDSFTPEALQRCVLACGADCLLQELGVNHVGVSFPGVMGVPEGFSQMRRIIESILPCHLLIDFLFRWCTWRETADYGLTWGDLESGSWHDWMVYRQ